MKKEELIKWLEDEKWVPLVRPTRQEMEVSDLLNAILDDIISRLKKL